MKGLGSHLRWRIQDKRPEQVRRILARADGWGSTQMTEILRDPLSLPTEIVELVRTERVARACRNSSVQDCRTTIANTDHAPGLKLALVREQRRGKRAGLIASLKRRIREIEEEAAVGSEDFYGAGCGHTAGTVRQTVEN